MAEDTPVKDVKETKSKSAVKTLETDFELVGLAGEKYNTGHIFEGEIPQFILAQIYFGTARLV